MNETIRKSLKTALVFAVIGAVAAMAVPPFIAGLATMGLIESAGSLGAATAAGIAHTTAVFGLFGLLVPPVEKLVDFACGKKSEHKESDAKCGDNLTINQDIDVGVDARSVNFVAKLNEQAAQSVDTTRQI